MAAFLFLQSMGLTTGLLLILFNFILKKRRPGRKESGFLYFFISFTFHFWLQILVYYLHHYHPEIPFTLLRLVTMLYYLVTGSMIYTGPYFCHRVLGIKPKRDIPFIILFALFEILIMVNFPYHWDRGGRHFIGTNILFNLTMLCLPIAFGYMSYMMIRKKKKNFRALNTAVFQAFMILTLIFFGVFTGADLIKSNTVEFGTLRTAIALDSLLYVLVCIKYLIDTLQALLPQGDKKNQVYYNPILVSSFNLSQREQEVFSHVLTGRSYKEIASHLNISESTIKTHVNRILHKSGCGNRTELLHTVLQ